MPGRAGPGLSCVCVCAGRGARGAARGAAVVPAARPVSEERNGRARRAIR